MTRDPRPMRWLAALAASLLTSACLKVGPDFVEPEFETSPAFVDQGGLFSPVSPEADWWAGFADLELTELVTRAVAHNLDVRVALAVYREARALRDETRFELAPIVTSGASYARVRVSEQTPAGQFNERDDDLYEVGLDASWELDVFGRIRRLIEARTAQIEVSEALVRDTLVVVIAEVGRNYFELRGNQARLAVARRNAENQRNTLELTDALLEGGRGTELDTARAREQLTTTLASIPPLEAAVERAAHRLAVLVGEPPQALRGTLLSAKPLPELPELTALGDPASLLRRRPDVRVAEQDLASDTALVGVTAADLFPRVTFVGNVSVQATSFSSLSASGSDAHTFGPRISWAAFDLGRVILRKRQAEARVDAALARYEQTVLLALEETENAILTYARQRARRDFLRDAAMAAGTASELARLRYEDGVSDFLAVLDAERRLLEAEDRLAESETATATSLIAIYLALGGSWEPWNLVTGTP